jgi:HEPN domain-containing protein
MSISKTFAFRRDRPQRRSKPTLLHRGLAFPYTHDLSRLIGILTDHGLEVPDIVLDAVDLSLYAVGTRYPGVAEHVTQEQHQEAVHHSESVVQWVEQIIEAKTDEANT